MAMKDFFHETDPYLTARESTATWGKINAAWASRPPLLTLSPEHRKRGWENLQKAGMPRDSWFVCIHCREAGYDAARQALHSFRDAHIPTFFLFIRQVTQLGGWVIRLGDPTMRRLPVMAQTIDYVHSEMKSDWMDLFLAAEAKCFLGTASGPAQLATVFGTPAGMTNLLPLSGCLGFAPRDVCIPKLLRLKSTREFIPFPAILDTKVGDFRVDLQYETAAIEWMDNTPNDILGLGKEMLEISEGKVVYTEEDERLQQRFKALLKPGHYMYGSAGRIGREFLRKHQALLADGVKLTFQSPK
jgi:putative glycosyltransferase (TIGR04372 family)